MAEKEITMYTLSCDECGKDYTDDFNNFVAWTEHPYDQAIDSGWNIDFKNKKHYCDECTEVNDDEVFSIKSGNLLFKK